MPLTDRPPSASVQMIAPGTRLRSSRCDRDPLVGVGTKRVVTELVRHHAPQLVLARYTPLLVGLVFQPHPRVRRGARRARPRRHGRCGDHGRAENPPQKAFKPRAYPNLTAARAVPCAPRHCADPASFLAKGTGAGPMLLMTLPPRNRARGRRRRRAVRSRPVRIPARAPARTLPLGQRRHSGPSRERRRRRTGAAGGAGSSGAGGVAGPRARRWRHRRQRRVGRQREPGASGNAGGGLGGDAGAAGRPAAASAAASAAARPAAAPAARRRHPPGRRQRRGASGSTGGAGGTGGTRRRTTLLRVTGGQRRQRRHDERAVPDDHARRATSCAPSTPT